MRKLLVQINVDLRIFVPATETLVCAFQELEVVESDGAGFCLGDLFAFIGDGIAEDVFVDEHCFAVVLHGRVE